MAVYLRVSTSEQSTDLQRTEILEYLKVRGWERPVVFEDKATGTNGKRPSLQEMLAKIRSGEFDIVICYKLDRLFRSLKDLILTLQFFSENGVEFVALKDNVDLTSPSGKLLTHILGAFGEFEASLIRSRVKSGLAEAKRKGKRLGRPKHGSEELILELRTKGYIYKDIARLAGCSIATVSRVVNRQHLQIPQVESFERTESE